MGSFCCFPCDDEFDENASPSTSIYRQCIGLGFLLQRLFGGVQYSPMSHRLEGRVSLPVQGSPTLSSSGSRTEFVASSLSDSNQFVSRQLPHDFNQGFSNLNDPHSPATRELAYDADLRYSRLQHDGLVSRREKSMTHFQEDSQPQRRNMTDSDLDSLCSRKKWSGVKSTEECEILHSDSSEKSSSMKDAYRLCCVEPCPEDEDVCPTCFDDYTPENPKIMTRCSHHFHLGCIYEWMERSESCPICGKSIELEVRLSGRGEKLTFKRRECQFSLLVALLMFLTRFFYWNLRRWNSVKAPETALAQYVEQLEADM